MCVYLGVQAHSAYQPFNLFSKHIISKMYLLFEKIIIIIIIIKAWLAIVILLFKNMMMHNIK
jgi:hypothetical protein